MFSKKKVGKLFGKKYEKPGKEDEELKHDTTEDKSKRNKDKKKVITRIFRKKNKSKKKTGDETKVVETNEEPRNENTKTSTGVGTNTSKKRRSRRPLRIEVAVQTGEEPERQYGRRGKRKDSQKGEEKEKYVGNEDMQEKKEEPMTDNIPGMPDSPTRKSMAVVVTELRKKMEMYKMEGKDIEDEDEQCLELLLGVRHKEGKDSLKEEEENENSEEDNQSQMTDLDLEEYLDNSEEEQLEGDLSEPETVRMTDAGTTTEREDEADDEQTSTSTSETETVEETDSETDGEDVFEKSSEGNDQQSNSKKFSTVGYYRENGKTYHISVESIQKNFRGRRPIAATLDPKLLTR